MQARLAHHEKIAALGRVAAQVAHEVRNPLAGLLALRDTFEGEGWRAASADERRFDSPTKIVETINHLTKTVNR